jgi:hypothetical protein
VHYGVAQGESNHRSDYATEQCVVLTHGWACYMNNQRHPPMRFGARKISADGAQAIVMEDFRADDWHQQMVATVARIKALSGSREISKTSSSSSQSSIR